MMRRIQSAWACRVLVVTTGAAALLAAACSDSSDSGTPEGQSGASSDGSGSSDGTTASGSGGTSPGGSGDGQSDVLPGGDPVDSLPSPSCEAAEDGGSDTVSPPELIATLFDRWHEAWLGSPAVADLDEDGTNEIVVPREDLLLVWHLDGSVVQRHELPGRIWAPPIVADLRTDLPGLEVAVASRQLISAWDAEGNALQGFPVEWRDEMRSIAAEDIDDDGRLELVAGTTSDLDANDQTDILIAINVLGSKEPSMGKKVPSDTEIMFSTFQIAETALVAEKMKTAQVDIYLKPKLRNIRVLEFHKQQEIMDSVSEDVEFLRRNLEERLSQG